jgi:tetratricopeptide (TPR) repeat protein
MSRQTTPTKSTSELYTEAIKAITIHQDTLRALRTIEELFKQDSNYAPAHHLLARISQDQETVARSAELAYLSDTTNRYYLSDYARAMVWSNNGAEAIAAYEKIVRTSNEMNDFRILAVLYEYGNNKEKAVAVLDSAIVRFGRVHAFCLMRQHLLLSLGRSLEAEAEAKKVVEEAPYIASNHIALAELYASTYRDSLALVSFHNAIAIDTLAAGPWLSLADYYEKKSDKSSYLSVLIRIFANKEIPVEDKIKEWDRLISNRQDYRNFYSLYDTLIKQLRIHHPDNKEISSLYINHLVLSGESKEALRLSKRIFNEGTPTLKDIFLVVSLEDLLGRPDSVVHYLDKGLKFYPNNADLLMSRGHIARERKEYDKALESYNDALLNTEDRLERGKICMTIGYLESVRKDIKSCYKAFDEALKYFDKNDSLRSDLYASLGDIEHERNDMKRCYKAYDKSIKYRADNEHVLNNYAYFLSLEGRKLEKALEMSTRANELSPNNPTFLDTKAWILYKLGRYTDAKKVMQQALSLNRSKSYEYPLHYGDILYALGEEFMAKVYWRKALELGADKEEIEKRFLPEQPKEKR